MKKSLFLPGQGEPTRYVVLVLISFTLMYIDSRTEWMNPVRGYLATPLYLLQRVVDAPGRLIRNSADSFRSREDLQADNIALHEQNRQLREQLLKYEAVVAENTRLLELLRSAPASERESMVGRLLSIDMTPARQRVTIDRGSVHGLNIGATFADANGMMGQITRVYPLHSEGLLISDPTHAIPVRVLRNGLRSIAIGTGYTDLLELQYLPANADIRAGDMLVTSGLGGRFPADYPVARVESVEAGAEQVFARVQAIPLARLDQSQEVLLFMPAPLIPREATESLPIDENTVVETSSVDAEGAVDAVE